MSIERDVVIPLRSLRFTEEMRMRQMHAHACEGEVLRCSEGGAAKEGSPKETTPELRPKG